MDLPVNISNTGSGFDPFGSRSDFGCPIEKMTPNPGHGQVRAGAEGRDEVHGAAGQDLVEGVEPPGGGGV